MEGEGEGEGGEEGSEEENKDELIQETQQEPPVIEEYEPDEKSPLTQETRVSKTRLLFIKPWLYSRSF